jgi:hypothetical protein
MNAVWSYESISKPNFNKGEIASARASILLWKSLYPEHTTNLVCDNKTIEYFTEIGLIDYYDVVVLLEQTNINKSVFWASCKLQAIKQIEAPLCHIDLDFFTWTKFEDFGIFDERMAASFKEETAYYYLDPKIATKGTNTKLNFSGIAYNTSFMYFADNEIKNKYCNTAIKYMEEASNHYDKNIFNKDKSLYMIFAEQQLFGEIAYQNNINVKTIIKEKYIAGHSCYEDDLFDNGILKECFAEKYLVHLGEFKKEMRNDINLQNNVFNHVEFLLKQ